MVKAETNLYICKNWDDIHSQIFDSGIKTDDESDVMMEKLNKLSENLEEKLGENHKKAIVKGLLENKLEKLENSLSSFLILTHTTEAQKKEQIMLMEAVIVYRKILEDF